MGHPRANQQGYESTKIQIYFSLFSCLQLNILCYYSCLTTIQIQDKKNLKYIYNTLCQHPGTGNPSGPCNEIIILYYWKTAKKQMPLCS